MQTTEKCERGTGGADSGEERRSRKGWKRKRGAGSNRRGGRAGTEGKRESGGRKRRKTRRPHEVRRGDVEIKGLKKDKRRGGRGNRSG